MSLVVQKYGGSSVATAEKIKIVAARIKRARRCRRPRRRRRLGDGRHDRRPDRRSRTQITDHPEAREMDVLLSTGETQSSALMVMALHALGVDAISLSGAQAGMRTDSRAPQRAHPGDRADARCARSSSAGASSSSPASRA